MNPGQFDWEVYCRRQRVLASIRVNRACDVEVMSAGVAPTLAEARVGVREWIALGFSPKHDADRALLQALMLGDRGPEMRGIERDFQKTGTSHLLSSSGVRMSVLAAMVYFLCRLVRARPRTSAAAITLSVVGWGCVTLFTAQGIRPVIVALMLGVGLALRRRVDSIHLLAFAALAILILQPLDLYSAGFQFSFVIVLEMLVLNQRVNRWLMRFSDPDLDALYRFGKLTPAQMTRRAIARHLSQALAASMVAWFVSIPLVAYHFEQFTPWAVPISILLSPVVFAALGLGFFKLIATMLVPSMAGVWAMIATVPVALLRWVMSLAAHLPMADIPVTQPPVWGIILFYALICLPLLPATRPRILWSLRCGPLAACAMLLLMPSLLGFASQSASTGTVRVTLLSIGAGQCAVVEPGSAGALMVDAGSTTLADPLNMAVAPFLHHEARRSMDAIYLSHGDYDHISATHGAVEEYGVGQIITTPFFRKHAAESRACEHLLEFLDATHHSPREVTTGQTFDWGGGVRAEVLWPTKQCDMNSNNAGMVLRVTCRGKSILFPADIQDPAMEALLKQPEKLRSDVLVAAHHGSSEPLTAAFVRAVNPEVIVSSNAARLTKKQRDFEQVIEHRPLYRTNECGAITIEIDKNGRLTVTPFLTKKQKGIVVERDGSVHGK
jgi:competence protein ComEC